MPIFAVFSAEGFSRGFYHVESADEAPAGAVIVTEAQWNDLVENPSTRKWDGSKVVTHVLPPPGLRGRTYKADIWRRATDVEAETIAAAYAALPLRKRNILNDATFLDHSDPLFEELVAGFIQAFGEARTSELLAVSE